MIVLWPISPCALFEAFLPASRQPALTLEDDCMPQYAMPQTIKPAQGGFNCLGWLMGFEPTTTGITIQDSTAELQPPLLR